jgi:hypothetical protein
MRRTFLNRASVFLVLACALAWVSPCFGWGADGHRIVAFIATARLTPQAKEDVKALLGNATLVDVASWPDQIRQERPETGPWHYVDIPVNAASYDAARDGKDGNNVIDAIDKFEKVLGDPSAPLAKRAEALKFVVHFCGDIHQPLHCAERDHDKGGNARLVFFLDRQMAVNLHACWDSWILLDSKGTTSDSVYAGALSARISQAQAAEWVKSTPVDWANESHQLAVDVVYKNVPEGGPPPKLGRDYVNAAKPVIDQQLEKGGVRLADVLNRVLAEPIVAPPATEAAPASAPAP